MEKKSLIAGVVVTGLAAVALLGSSISGVVKRHNEANLRFQVYPGPGVEPVFESESLRKPNAYSDVFVSINRKNKKVFGGEAFSENFPSVEDALLRAHVLKGSGGLGRDPPGIYVEHGMENAKISVTYRIDPQNKIRESNERDNMVVIDLTPSQLHWLALEKSVQISSIYHAREEREEEARKVSELEKLGYTVTKR